METMLKKPEIFRDSMGRFDRHGKTLAKTQKKTGLIKKPKSRTAENNLPKDGRGGVRAGAGRPKGAKGKIPLALKEAILASLDELGGKEYLKTLAIENSSAYAGLIGKVLPTTLSGDESSGGLGVKMVFERHIVWPDGRREIDGVTPKQLPAPASHALPGSDTSNSEDSDDKSDT
jgi:hypothetical protein